MGVDTSMSNDELDELLEQYANAITTNAGDAWTQEEAISDVKQSFIEWRDTHTQAEVERARVDELKAIPHPEDAPDIAMHINRRAKELEKGE